MSIAELDQLPNRYVHSLYKDNFNHQIELLKNPKLAESEATAQALGSVLTGNI